MSCDDDKPPATEIDIPSVMIPEAAGKTLRAAMSRGRGKLFEVSYC